MFNVEFYVSALIGVIIRVNLLITFIVTLKISIANFEKSRL